MSSSPEEGVTDSENQNQKHEKNNICFGDGTVRGAVSRSKQCVRNQYR
jgi:hypothetical protein